MGSLPEGETLPNIRSVKAGPAIVPKCHAYNTESTYGRIGYNNNDRPA